MDDKDTGTGGRQPTGLGDVLQGGGTGVSSIRFEDVGNDPTHGKVPEKFLEKGHREDQYESSKATGGWEMGLLTDGDSDGGSGV